MTAPGSATRRYTVTEEDTASAVGSGSLEVLGTPRLLAWAEAVTCAAVDPELEASQTSVGTQVSLEHRAPSAVGEAIQVTARIVDRDGRRLRFEVEAVDSSGTVVGCGEISRVVVDSARFFSRLRK